MIAAQILYGLILVFIGCMWIRFIVDWVQVFARSWSPRGVLLVVLEGVYSVTDPPLRAVRGVIPPLRLGSVMLDLSPMILIIGIYILQAIVAAVFS